MTDTAPARPAAEPIIKAKDVAYARFSAPDLDLIEQFVTDFGLVVVHRDDDVLYSRGIEATPFLHVVHRGPAKFLGWAFEVDDEADLHRLAEAVEGCSPVHDIGGVEGELGGGRRVHFVEPITGFVLEAVHGQQAEALDPARDRIVYNYAGIADRRGDLQDVGGNRFPNAADPGSPEVLRLGHCVAAVPLGAHQQFMAFLAETFGMLVSDAIEFDSKVMAQFMRMDRGDEFTDHHSVFVLGLMDPKAAQADGTVHAQLSHISFEVYTIDDVFRGHMSMRARQEEGRRYALAWGVGRHVYGSQVYDYWHDPYGHVHERMCDGDVVDTSYGPVVLDAMTMGPNGGNQWGPTVAESSVQNLDGPQCAPYFDDLPDEVRASLVSRDLSELSNVIDSL